MSNAKMVQGLSISSLQIIIGFVRNTGLIFGQLLGQLISVLYILKSVTKNCKKNNIPKYKQVINIAKAYKNMPMYSTPGAFADTLSLQMPIFMISHFFGTFITGIFSFTFRILNMPSSLISSAISQVLYKKINDAIKYKNYNIIMSLVVKVFVGLLLLILPFAFIIWFFGEDIFSFIFGDEWKHAGELAGILVFAVVIRFSVSPLSSVLLIEQNIKLGVSWQITYLITISITLFFFRNYEIQNFLWIFVIHELLLYLLYFVVILIGVKRLQEIQ
jgi:O-antigen/teichoic acid export membrane protein